MVCLKLGLALCSRVVTAAAAAAAVALLLMLHREG